MVSPELLRRYPFFSLLKEGQLAALAMIADEVTYQDQEIIFEEGQPAQALYFLLQGSVDLYYTTKDGYKPSDRQEISVCLINPGEPFGISALIEPHILASSGRSENHSRVLKFDAQRLRELIRDDPQLEIILLRKMAQTALERLHATRIQLAAAWTS